jgi:hypothetical protein
LGHAFSGIDEAGYRAAPAAYCEHTDLFALAGIPGHAPLESTVWCHKQRIALEQTHTSGHADPATLVRLAKALNATMVIPIHTEAPGFMQTLIPNVRILRDGDWLTL